MTSNLALLFPSEIMAEIVFELAYSELSKKQLGTCSRVCRYWAQVCRPSLFRKLVLRNAADLDHLLFLLTISPLVAPSLAQCLDEVAVVHPGPRGLPWIHRLPRIRQHTTRVLTLHLEVQQLEIWGTAHLLSTSLPLTLPRSTFPFSSLRIADVRLKKVKDLVRAVRDLPELSTLHCSNVTFEDESLVDERAVRTRRRNFKPTHPGPVLAVVQDCTDPCLEKVLMHTLLIEMYDYRYSSLDKHTFCVFRKLLMALAMLKSTSPSLYGESCGVRIPSSLRLLT